MFWSGSISSPSSPDFLDFLPSILNMSHGISTRLSLRWLPDPPSEPTDTLVYNVGSYFVDLRVLKSDNSIDWAMAGERQVISQDPRVYPPIPLPIIFTNCFPRTVKCRWIKIIDSLGPSDPDEGSFTTFPNGDDLETGSMPHPETGVVTKYEEVWRNLKPREGVKHAWILQSVDEKCFLGRIGGGYVALREAEGKLFGARREEWDVSEGWSVKYKIGDVEGVPSLAARGKEAFDGEERWKIGDNVEVLGEQYVVMAWEDLANGS